MIRRYDEVLLEKANKMAIKELYEYCQATFTKVKPFTEASEEFKERLKKLSEETK